MSTNVINIIVNGAHGRMGLEAVNAIKNTPNLRLVAGLDQQDNLANAIKQHHANVVVDFTNAKSVFENTKTIIANKACPVIGSSGLLDEQIHHLSLMAQEYKISGIIVPNFSLGAVLMMKFAETAAKYFKQVEIIERHHANKLDAPSGTALRTAALISKNLQNTTIHNTKSEELLPGALGASYHNIPIHSLRLSGSCAHQTVLFGGEDETLNITHDSLNRKSFMPGVVLACQKVQTLKGLKIGLEHVLDL
jgi:4-hydroxy-tetrahydrodipicolinate reductase